VAKEINLNSEEWCDLVFEGKNKSYGAYQMRQTSTKRHIIAFILIILILIFLAFLPALIQTVRDATRSRDSMTQVNTISKLDLEQEKLKDKDIIKTEVPVPKVILKNTIKNTEVIIADDKDVRAEDELKSMDNLKDSKATISIKDIVGSSDEHAVDIADLEDNKKAIEEKPLVGVEQMPEFPGGEAELMKFLSENVHYPTSASEMGIEGRVILRFVVSKTGEVSQVEVMRGLDPACDKEAVRVVKMMPKWIPGRQNGRNVPVYFTLPIKYQLNKP